MTLYSLSLRDRRALIALARQHRTTPQALARDAIRLLLGTYEPPTAPRRSGRQAGRGNPRSGGRQS
jgi:hypothetical protein